MKIEKLSSKSNKKVFLMGFILCAIIMILINLLTSKAKYQNTQSINIATGKVSYSVADLNMVAMYKINDDESEEKIDAVPGDGYILNEESKCTIKGANGEEEKDSKITIEYINNEIKIDHMTKKGTKCYIYFEKQPTIKDKLVPNGETLGTLTTVSGTTCDSGCTDNKSGIYTATDYDNNPSYVWRGTVDNNLVHFAGYYWRIIRVNGDGSIRLIYDGTAKHDNGENSEDRQIGTRAYNTKYDNNMYVGFRYESGKKQGNITPSTILGADTCPAAGTLNKWYEDNIKGKPAEDHIDKNAIFCNDRRSSTSTTTFANRNNQGGTGSSGTYYGAYLRILPNNSWGSSQEATLSCEEADRFSAKGATKGNGTLIYPIGLITADEVLLAGGFGNKTNYKYYLYTGQNYWTMSPYLYPNAYVFRVTSDGYLGSYYVDREYGVRPVINLRADTTFSSGNGSYEKPYEVS